MGPYWQNQHFEELRRKAYSSIHCLVLNRGLPSLDSKLERFVTKIKKKAVAKLESAPTDYIATEIFVTVIPDADQTAINYQMYVQHTNINPS